MAKKNSMRKSEIDKLKIDMSPVPTKVIEGEVISLPKLSKQEMEFVGHYVVFANGTEAARHAGYQHQAIRQQAHKLLTTADIQVHIKAARERLGELHFDLANSIMSQLDAMRTADPTMLFDDNGMLKAPKDWPSECALLVSGMEVDFQQGVTKVKLDSRRMVMETMAKILGHIKGGDGDGENGGVVNNFNVQVNCIVGGVAVKS